MFNWCELNLISPLKSYFLIFTISFFYDLMKNVTQILFHIFRGSFKWSTELESRYRPTFSRTFFRSSVRHERRGEVTKNACARVRILSSFSAATAIFIKNNINTHLPHNSNPHCRRHIDNTQNHRLWRYKSVHQFHEFSTVDLLTHISPYEINRFGLSLTP